MGLSSSSRTYVIYFLVNTIRSLLQHLLPLTMAAKLCCIAPQRTESPDLPNARILAATERTGSHAEAIASSAATSTRTEDRQDLQRIFGSATETSDVKDSGLNPKTVTKSPSVIAKLRKRLSKSGSKSQFLLSDDADPHITPKLRVSADAGDSLLNTGKIGHGGYDPDAGSIAIRESLASTTRNDLTMPPLRGKRIPRRSPLQDIEWRSRSRSMTS